MTKFTTHLNQLQKTYPSQGGSMMYPAKGYITSTAATFILGLRAANLTHPALQKGCEKLPRQLLQGCASSTFYQIKIYKSYLKLQKMHPSRGGSLTHPAKGRARTTLALLNITSGSCAANTMYPACQWGRWESVANVMHPASMGGCRTMPRQPFQGCASFTSYQNTIYTSSQCGTQCQKSTVKTLRKTEHRADYFYQVQLAEAQMKVQPHPLI